MADHSKIEWTEATWNPITGCSRASEGCRHCYAALLAATRLKNHASRVGLAAIDAHGEAKFNGQVRFNEQWLDQPLRWRRPRMIFVCAHADLFHESVPDEWIDRVFAVMALAPQHTFQCLTKRSARMREYLTARNGMGDSHLCRAINEIPAKMGNRHGALSMPLPNVWLGVSVEDQQRADERIPDLLATPAAVRWISAEPLLGPVDLTNLSMAPFEHSHASWKSRTTDSLAGHYWGEARSGKDGPYKIPSLDWIVCGGESGKGARPMHPDWPRSLRDQCHAAGVPFFFKQWGEFWPAELVPARDDATPWRTSPDGAEAWLIDDGGKPREELDPVRFLRLSKKRAGRMLDGHFHDALPVEQPRLEVQP